MKPVLDYYDPDAFFIKPDPTPNFVYRMPDREHSEGAIALDLTAFPKLMTEDGLVVFGEYSRVKRLEWHLPTVITQTMITSAGLTLGSDPDAFFENNSQSSHIAILQAGGAHAQASTTCLSSLS